MQVRYTIEYYLTAAPIASRQSHIFIKRTERGGGSRLILLSCSTAQLQLRAPSCEAGLGETICCVSAQLVLFTQVEPFL